MENGGQLTHSHPAVRSIIRWHKCPCMLRQHALGCCPMTSICTCTSASTKSCSFDFLDSKHLGKTSSANLENAAMTTASTPSALLQVFLTREYLAISMEFAQGGDLFAYTLGPNSYGKLAEVQARWIFQQLMLGLDYCHRKVEFFLTLCFPAESSVPSPFHILTSFPHVRLPPHPLPQPSVTFPPGSSSSSSSSSPVPSPFPHPYLLPTCFAPTPLCPCPSCYIFCLYLSVAQIRFNTLPPPMSKLACAVSVSILAHPTPT